jgi:hypothetical protein
METDNKSKISIHGKKLIMLKSFCILSGLVIIVLGYFSITSMRGGGKIKNVMDTITSSVGIETEPPKLIATSTKENISEDIRIKDPVRRKIDGVWVERGKDNFYPISIMIENHIDSRPPAGLSRANLVYEAEAEGGITRFLAIYATDENIEKIGPIRSARPYYVDWAKEYAALYVHCGGSPDALAKIIKERILDLNEFYNARIFWRDKSRPAPHNVYTSTEKLSAYLGSIKRVLTVDYEEWKYKDDNAHISSTTANEIKIPGKRSDYDIRWVYDNNMNTYERFEGGVRHKDENGDKINSKNIIIVYAKTNVLDEKGRIAIITTGTGKAAICLDGKCETGKWAKKNGKRTHFYYLNGNEIELNQGTTWVEVVTSWTKISIK